MTRAHFVKKARKNYPDAGIKKGESYWWWSFRFRGKHFSKTQPRPSQLISSPFLSGVASVEESLADLDGDLNEAKTCRDDAISELQNLAGEAQSGYDNMPEGLQQGETGQLLESRVSEIESMISDLEGVDLDLEKAEKEADEDFQKKVESAIEELQAVSYQGE